MSIRRSSRLATKPSIDYEVMDDSGVRIVKTRDPVIVRVPKSALEQYEFIVDESDVDSDDDIEIDDSEIDELNDDLKDFIVDDSDDDSDDDVRMSDNDAKNDIDVDADTDVDDVNELDEDTDEDTDEVADEVADEDTDEDTDDDVCMTDFGSDDESVGLTEYHSRDIVLDLGVLHGVIDDKTFATINAANCNAMSIRAFLVASDFESWVTFGFNGTTMDQALDIAFSYSVHRKSFATNHVANCDLCRMRRTLSTHFELFGDDNNVVSSLATGCYCAFRLWTFLKFVEMLSSGEYENRAAFMADFMALVYRESHVLYKAWL